jgi:hypothetical protein
MKIAVSKREKAQTEMATAPGNHIGCALLGANPTLLRQLLKILISPKIESE